MVIGERLISNPTKYTTRVHFACRGRKCRSFVQVWLEENLTVFGDAWVDPSEVCQLVSLLRRRGRRCRSLCKCGWRRTSRCLATRWAPVNAY